MARQNPLKGLVAYPPFAKPQRRSAEIVDFMRTMRAKGKNVTIRKVKRP